MVDVDGSWLEKKRQELEPSRLHNLGQGALKREALG
jgi:hypothetical protein